MSYTFGVPITQKEYPTVMGAIPSGILTLLKGVITQVSLPSLDPKASSEGCVFLTTASRNNNHHTRSLFQKYVIRTPYDVSYWLKSTVWYLYSTIIEVKRYML